MGAAPDETHPFGYGKERFFWAFIAAIFIFVAGASFSIYGGVTVVLTGQDEGISNLAVSFGILAVAFVAEGTSFIRAFRQAAPDDAGPDEISRTVARIRRSKDPTVKTVLFEDGAALTGIVIAAAGLFAYRLTDDTVWDGVATILIGVLLVWVAVTLGRDVKGLLLGEAASPEIRDTLREVIGSFDAVDAVLEVLTMHLAPRPDPGRRPHPPGRRHLQSRDRAGRDADRGGAARGRADGRRGVPRPDGPIRDLGSSSARGRRSVPPSEDARIPSRARGAVVARTDRA